MNGGEEGHPAWWLNLQAYPTPSSAGPPAAASGACARCRREGTCSAVGDAGFAVDPTTRVRQDRAVRPRRPSSSSSHARIRVTRVADHRLRIGRPNTCWTSADRSPGLLAGVGGEIIAAICPRGRGRHLLADLRQRAARHVRVSTRTPLLRRIGSDPLSAPHLKSGFIDFDIPLGPGPGLGLPWPTDGWDWAADQLAPLIEILRPRSTSRPDALRSSLLPVDAPAACGRRPQAHGGRGRWLRCSPE